MCVSSASTHPRHSPEWGRPSSQAAARGAGQNTSPSERPPYVVSVVLNWNNLPDTLECVDSIWRSDYSNLGVWVVDNASREDPSPVLRERYPDVRVLRNATNLGYGGGNNSGLRPAMDEGAAYVLFLNNDAIVAPDCVRRLVAAAEADGRIGMATPRVFYYDRPTEIYWDGGIIDWTTGETSHDSRELPVEGELRRSEWLDGSALFVRMSAVREIGVLDERYFLYFEDAEWSVRASRRGWMNVVVLQGRAWHKVSRSTGGKTNPAVRFYYARNRCLFMSAHGPSAKRFSWKLQYARRLYREYWLGHQNREAREAIVAACLSLLARRWGPYEAIGGGRVVQILDRVVLLVTRGAVSIKRFLRRILGVRQRPMGGRSDD
jgi:GT2 family glycosyltransferase